MPNPLTELSHFYFERYEVRDGESEYSLMSVRSTTEPLDCDDWLREFLEFAWSSNGERPWSERRIREFLRSEDPDLEVYGGTRVYRRFNLVEVPQEHYES